MIAQAIIRVLQQDQPVSNACSGRVSRQLRPEHEPSPCIVVGQSSAGRNHTLTGASGLVRASIVVTIWGRSSREVTSLAKLVRLRLLRLRGMVGPIAEQGDVKVEAVIFQNEADDIEAANAMPQRKEFAVTQTYTVWAQEQKPEPALEGIS